MVQGGIPNPDFLDQRTADLALKNLNYNTPGGKLNRGLSVVDTYKILVGQELSEAVHLKVSILGWAVELVPTPLLALANCKLQAYFLVADDIMDNSITRRGQPCWYRCVTSSLKAFRGGILILG